MSNLRPFLSSAALVIAIFLPVTSHAQRMMAGGGGRSAGARPAGPARVGAPRPVARPGLVMRPGIAARPAGSIGVRSNRFGATTFPFRDRFHRHNCFGGFPCRNRFFNSGLLFPGYYPYYDPFFDNYAQAQPPQEVVSNDNGTNLQLALEVQRLSDKIDEMESQERQAAAPRPPAQGSITAQSPAESTAFIFRDGHRVTAQNYAIVGDTLWVLGEHTAKKVSLANLDKAATEQANAANGIDLRLP